MNIGNFLDISEFRYPDKTAVVCKDRRYTFSRIKERVQRLMTGLAGLGVKKGDRVATLMWNSAEMMEINLAAMRLGAVFAPMNFRFKARELAYVVENAGPSVLVTDELCQDLAADVPPRLLDPECLFSTSHRAVPECKPYESLIEENVAFEGSVPVAGGDPCQLLYTSGTTARPKGVILSHDNVMWNAFNMIHARADSADDVSLVVGPLFHAAALNSHYVPRLALGGTLIIMDKFEPGVMMSLIQAEGATVVPGNPTLFIMLLDHCAGKRYDTSTVTKLTSGSDKTSRSY